MHAAPLFRPGAGSGPPLFAGLTEIGMGARVRKIITAFPAKAGTHRPAASSFAGNRKVHQPVAAWCAGTIDPGFCRGSD